MTRRTKSHYPEAVAVLILSVIFAIWFGNPILSHFGQPHDSESISDDWDLFTELRFAPYVELSQYHQAPLWDPYRCGGLPMLGYAESGFLSPWFVLSLIFGPFAGIDLEILLHLAIAFAGGYMLGRVLSLRPLASLGCAAVFPASSWYYLHIAIGHLTFLPYAYLPWILGLFVMSMNRRMLGPAAIAGALFALGLGEGGLAHMFIYALPFISLLSVLFALFDLSFWPLVSGATTLFFALALGAIKLLPVAAYSSSRLVYDPSYTSLAMFVQMFFSRNQDLHRSLAGANWGYWEYGAYLGFPFAALAMIGMVKNPRRSAPWAITALVMLAISAGDFAANAPWQWFHALPVFDSLRVPSRWIIPFIAALAPIVGYGIERLGDGVHWREVIAALLVIAGLTDAWWVVSRDLGYIPIGPAIELQHANEFQQVWDPYQRHMFRLARAGFGALNCENEIVTWRPSTATGSNQSVYRGEQYLTGRGAIHLILWTPNLIEYEVDAPSATTIIVNQNYDAGWRVIEGRGRLAETGGLLAIVLASGHQRLEIAYRGHTAVMGVAISMIALVTLIAVLVYELKGARSASAAPQAFAKDGPSSTRGNTNGL